MNEGRDDSNPFKSKTGFDSTAPSREVEDFHRRDDVDSSDRAHHHTLGFKSGQAVSGALLAKLVKAGAFGRIGDYQFNDTGTETDIWKLANGQLLLIKDYPDAFALWGTRYGGDGTTTFGVPNAQEKFLAARTESGGSFLTTVGQTGGVFGNKLSHTHTTPVHNHTITHTHNITNEPAHSHTITAQGGGTAQSRAAGTATPTLAAWTALDGHAHGGNTGTDGAHSHGGATQGTNTANSGDASPSTNGHTFSDPTLPGFGNEWFTNLPPYLVTRLFVRVKLGI